MSKVYREFQETGRYKSGIKVSELIENLEMYKRLNGDQEVEFVDFYGDQSHVQFVYHKNGLEVVVGIEE